MLGGKVKENIDAGVFKNACALRMSYALNKAGITIPATAGKTVSGAGGKQYFFRVKDLIRFMRSKFGKADVDKTIPKASDFSAKGILVFKVAGWLDATGHVTVWDGTNSLEATGNYFTRANRAYLWALK